MLQGCCSVAGPSHGIPPHCGEGSAQDRVLDCIPPLHVELHVDQTDHIVQLPSTEVKCYR